MFASNNLKDKLFPRASQTSRPLLTRPNQSVCRPSIRIQLCIWYLQPQQRVEVIRTHRKMFGKGFNGEFILGWTNSWWENKKATKSGALPCSISSFSYWRALSSFGQEMINMSRLYSFARRLFCAMARCIYKIKGTMIKLKKKNPYFWNLRFEYVYVHKGYSQWNISLVSHMITVLISSLSRPITGCRNPMGTKFCAVAPNIMHRVSHPNSKVRWTKVLMLR